MSVLKVITQKIYIKNIFRPLLLQKHYCIIYYLAFTKLDGLFSKKEFSGGYSHACWFTPIYKTSHA